VVTGGGAYWEGRELVLMGKPYSLPYHFLLLQNKKESTAKVFTTRFASALSLHNIQPNLL